MAGRVLNPLASSGWVARAALLVAIVPLTLARPAGALIEGAYRRGETVEIEGIVTTSGGAPVPDLRIVLLASHKGFELRSMRRAEEGLVRVPARTDELGRFALEWTWNPYYDTFRIRAEGAEGTTATAQSGLPPGVLVEVDLTRRMDQGSPVVVALEVGAGAAETATAAPQSDDQRRIYEEMGNPDRVDRLPMPGGDEVAWWYFERGRSYHFRDGSLDQVMEFEPVKGTSGSPQAR